MTLDQSLARLNITLAQIAFDQRAIAR
jgi:hypothetical protein